MRARRIASLVGALCLLALPGARAADKSSSSITFDGQKLYLASDESNATVQLREFLPKGETFDHWTRLAGLFLYPKDTDPKRVVENLVHALQQANPDAKSSVMENSTTGELIVDFITWPADQSFVEFDIFKYFRNAKGQVSAQQYALRAYGDFPAFFKSLQTLRPRLIEAMARDGLVTR